MLTLRDCVDLSGVEPDEIDAVAEHERLSYIVAMEKGSWLLEQAWGAPALRQMVRDDIATAADHGAWHHADELRVTYDHMQQRLPEGTDRRHMTRH